MRRIDTKEIAAKAGVCRRHATSRIVTRADFPKPVVNLSQKNRLWREDQVDAYLAKGRR
jgi:hypothetical protein